MRASRRAPFSSPPCGLLVAPLPLPRLVGARLREGDAGELAALDLRAQGVEPDRRPARVPLRAAGRRQREREVEAGLARHGGDAPPALSRVPRPDQRSCHTVVPARSKTRRPSESHFATPASPWSARSIGGTTTFRPR